MDVFTYQGTMEIHECPTCHMSYAATDDFFRRMSEKGEGWYCPRGHSVVFRESQAEKMRRLEKDLERQRARARHLDDQREAAQLSARAYKGQVTKIKNRVKNGVCPFCNRSFANVRDHMESEHHDIDTTEKATQS